MKKMWSAANIRMVGAGVAETPFLRELAELVGDRDVRSGSVSRGRGGRSTSQSLRREKILENEKALIDEHGTKLEAFKDLSQNLREQQDSRATLVYWRDEAGEHSFITEHLSIDRTH